MRRFALTAVLCMLLLISLGAGNPGLTDKEVYRLGEQATISVPAVDGAQLVIEAPDARYRLIEAPSASHVFTPTTLGEHNVTILDEQATVLVRGSFEVVAPLPASTYRINVDPLQPRAGRNVTIRITPAPEGIIDITIYAPGGHFKYVGPWQDAAFVPKAAGTHEVVISRDGVVIGRQGFDVLPQPRQLIATDKHEYGPFERIVIDAAEGIGSDWYLLITSGAQASKYYGAQRRVEFVPLEAGRQVIQAVALDGSILDEIVVDAAESALPVASTGFIVEDRHGRHRQLQSRIILTPHGNEVELIQPTQAIRSIRFRGVGSSVLHRLKAEDTPPATVNGVQAVQSYAIDPTTLSFTNATVSAIAKGTELYKCKDYNYSTGVCFGEWTKVRDIVPGEEYRFLLTPEDPLYSELNTTFRCSCADADSNSNAGTLECNVFCAFTINVPANATSFFLQRINYTVTVTINPDSTTVSNSHQYGLFDHDQTANDGDETPVGHSTNTATTTFTWTNSSLLSSGARSFTNLDCDNWPNYCTYYVYLNASYSYQAPGASRKAPNLNISLTNIGYDLNYTVPGPFSVTLNTPPNNAYRSNLTVTFNFTPTSDNTLTNCSVFTNETSWSAKNTTTSPVNATPNLMNVTFGGDGTYLWNVRCFDSTNTSVFAPTNYTVNVDTTPPVPRQMAPANGATYTSSNVVAFTYNVSDASPLTNCSLYVDGARAKTDSSVTRDQEETINHNLVNGLYNWSIGCFDEAGHFNMTGNRTLNVSVPITILSGLWYETYTSNCGTLPCEIDAAQSTDGTANYISATLSAASTSTAVNASSSYMGSNGGVINSGSSVTFSTFFQSSAGNINVRWYLYQMNESGQTALICSNTGGTSAVSGAASTGTCSPSSTIRLESTDRFNYVITLENTHPSQTRSFNHTIDHASSFFNATNFTQLGTMTVSMVEPTANMNLLQGNSFTLTCSVTCTGGSCLGTQVRAQHNASGSWANIGAATTPVGLNASETNPHSLGTIFNTTQTTSFAINGTQAGTTNIRCYAESTYATAESSLKPRITVQNNQAPTITLNSPANNTWNNSINLTFFYTPSTLGVLANCSLYLNGAYNQTNTSVITIDAQNNFTVRNIPEGTYNWSVTCIDTADLQGWSVNYTVRVDQRRPHNITLHAPGSGITTTNPNVLFNWTAVDNIAPNMSCQLVINNTVNQTLTSYNDTSTNVTVGLFEIGFYVWYVNCTDLAGNRNQSEIRNFSVNDEPPTASLTSPGNNTAVNSTNVTFIYNASDNYELTNCSLYVNGIYNQSNQSPLVNGQNNFTGVILQETSYNWSIACVDDALNNVSTTNYTFRVDITLPTIALSAPTNESVWNTSSITFTYTATDVSATLSCTIYVNATANITSTATSGTPKSESGSGYRDGYHDWNVSCSDAANNSNVSDTWYFTINQTPTIALDSPAAGTHLRFNVTMLYTATDNDGFTNCSLYLNGAYNQTNVTNVTSEQQRNFTVTDPAEGQYNWSVACYDSGAFLNFNMTQNRTFTVDNTPPNIVLNMPTNGEIIETSTVRFNWTVTDNFATGLLCNITVNQTVNATNVVSTNGGFTTYNVTGFRSGDYNWSIACIDNATNRNVSGAWNFTVRIPPKVNLTAPANDTYDVLTTVKFSYLPYDGSGTFTNCSIYLNGVVNQTNDSILAEQVNNFTVTGLADGRYDWNVSCYDTNNLVGQGTGRTYYVDTQPPYNITLLNPPNASVVTRNNVSFTFYMADLISPNATCDLTLDDGGGAFTLAANLNVTNGTEYTHYSVQSDGDYSWNVSCIDIAGNYNVSVTFNFTIDAPPNVTLVSPANQTWNNTGSVTFTYTPDDDILIKNCSLYLNGVLNQSNTIILNKQNNTFSITGAASAAYNWTVGCFDSDDNFFAPANRTLYIDRQNATIALNAPASAATLVSSAVTFNWTATDNLAFNLTCDLTINGTVNQSNVVVNNSVAYATTISTFTDGLFLWNVSCTDQATNRNTSETRNFTVAEPPKVVLHAPANGTRTAKTALNFTYTPSDNSGAVSTCFVTLNSQQNASNGTPITLNQQNNITQTGLTHNTWLWDVNCTDPSSNQGNNGTSLTLYVDLEGPVVTLVDPAEAETFNSNNISFNWTASDFNSSVLITCNLSVSNLTNGPILVTDLTGLSGEYFNTTVSGLSDGTHYWNVTCSDDLGNANISLTRSFIINQPDLVLNESSRITFNSTNPGVGETINITANVTNIGGLAATNANVTFWDGDPAAGGTYIGSYIQTVPSNQSVRFWVLWNITDGYHTIHVSADPADLIIELNETNNNASRNISAIKINITYPENNTYTSDNTPRIDFNITDFTENNLTYRIFVDGTYNGQTGNVTPGSNTSISLSTLSDGQRRIVIQATDSLGRSRNSTAWLFRIDTTAPTVNFTTANASWFRTQDPTIRFNITDLFSATMNYTVYLDGVLNTSNTTSNNTLTNVTFSGLSEGTHTVIVQATDNVSNTGNSTALTFYVDITAPEPNITTANHTWFSTNAPNITFNITDNMDDILNWSFFVDGSINTNGSAANASAASGLLAGIAEGTHTVILQSFDEAGNYRNSTPVTINVDTTLPNVTLVAPANDTNISQTSVTLNFTANDNMAHVLVCNLTLDDTVVQQFNLSNGTYGTYLATALSGGYHHWNATCIDNATNRRVSDTWRFFVQLPDFTITAGNITFSNSTPVENQTIQVNATIFNIGDINVSGNITVQFWSGDPDSGGTQINGNHTIQGLNISQNVTLTQNYTTIIGLNRIYVVVDPPTSTNGSHPETNESNNKASNSFWIGLYEVFAGTSSNELQIADTSIISAFTWNQTEVNESNVFVADSESSISFTSLHAIGLNTTNGTDVGTSDFVEIDTKINTSALNDSVNLTWTSGGQPIGYRNITAYKKRIIQIPAVNSTNTSAFRTGILWDTSDANPGFYNGSQDIVFHTVMNQSQVGQYGTYDYEIRIPATLRDYVAGGSTVTFYTELR